MTTTTSKTIMYSTIVFSILILTVGVSNVYAASEPDRTDYVAMWKIIDEQIRENQKEIAADKLQIEDMGSKLSSSEKSAIEKKISEKTTINTKLWNKVNELEQLNIKSYQLDPETKEKFANAVKKLQDKYLNKDSVNYVGENGVQDVHANTKQREIVVLLDVSKELLDVDSATQVASIIAEIKNTVNDVDVKIEFGKLQDIACTTRTSVCNPAKGGVQIQRQNSGGGSTLSFKATHGTHGNGFVVAGHEAVAVNNNIVQPTGGSVFGTTKVMGSSTCDCAFVKLASGKSVDNTIWAPEVGSTYPIASRVGASAHVDGTFLNISGVGSGVSYTDIRDHGSTWGRMNIALVGGDSGATLYKPLVNGNANLYGLMTTVSGSTTWYEPWHHVKSDLSLTD